MDRPKSNLQDIVKDATEKYVQNDGDPLTLGSVMQEIPKQIYSHGRIYDVVQACASFSTESRERLDVFKRQYDCDDGCETESGFVRNAVVKLSRHDGEVRLASSLYKYQGVGDGDDIGMLMSNAFNDYFQLGAHVSSDLKQLNIVVDDVMDHDDLFEERRRYKVEPIYNVDADVVQDL